MPLHIWSRIFTILSIKKYRQTRILTALSILPRHKYKTVSAAREIGIAKTMMVVMISLTFSSSSLASIRNRNAAVWIWKVAVGKNSDSRIRITS